MLQHQWKIHISGLKHWKFDWILRLILNLFYCVLFAFLIRKIEYLLTVNDSVMFNMLDLTDQYNGCCY